MGSCLYRGQGILFCRALSPLVLVCGGVQLFAQNNKEAKTKFKFLGFQNFRWHVYKRNRGEIPCLPWRVCAPLWCSKTAEQGTCARRPLGEETAHVGLGVVARSAQDFFRTGFGRRFGLHGEEVESNCIPNPTWVQHNNYEILLPTRLR